MSQPALALAALCVLALTAVAGPPTAEQAARESRALAELSRALTKATDDDARFAALARAVKEEPSPDVRARMLDLAPRQPGPDLDAFLTGVLVNDPDAGLRSRAAAALGRQGTAKALAPLARAAATDATTDLQIGCIRGRSSARRTATFALADLATRHPALADEAAARLRGLPGDPPPGAPRDPEDLADARRQALFRVTHDAALLQPFFTRLASADPRERERGVIAFRFLGLTKAPDALAAAVNDPDPNVRSWAALVLKEIASPPPPRP